MTSPLQALVVGDRFIEADLFATALGAAAGEAGRDGSFSHIYRLAHRFGRSWHC